MHAGGDETPARLDRLLLLPVRLLVYIFVYTILLFVKRKNMQQRFFRFFASQNKLLKALLILLTFRKSL